MGSVHSAEKTYELFTGEESEKAFLIGDTIGNVIGGILGYNAGADAASKMAREAEAALKGSTNSVNNCLPNFEKATINPKKLTEYALNPEHPVGGNKAKVFESALGYNKSNAEELMKQVYSKLPQCEAVEGLVDQYGKRFTVNMPIAGPNGNTVNVITGWIIKIGSEIPELTTIYVK